MKNAIQIVEKGLVPDPIVRWGIRRLLAGRLEEERRKSNAESFIDEIVKSPVAPVPEKANEQHYEVPPEFFTNVMGRHMKYSSCYFTPEISTLDQAEEAMLEITARRAEIEDGMSILELGCGWGSLSLYMAERFPNAKITGVSNSAPQREYIQDQCAKRGIKNLQILTRDMNRFEISEKFDRVVSVEMFEHMRNYQELLARISRWLKDDGKLFVHIFCHRKFSYPFETDGDSNWMGRYFFTGGIMPSQDLLGRFNRDLRIEKKWDVEGTHYQKTSEAWLKNLDKNRAQVMKVLAKAYGAQAAATWFVRWRLFFLACAELFGFKDGKEWLVCHYLFTKTGNR